MGTLSFRFYLKGVKNMYATLFMDLVSFLGVLIICTLIAVVGCVLIMAIVITIYFIISAFKKKDSEDKNDGSNT